MGRFTYLLSITVMVFALAAAGMIGCEGPAGPAGIDGIDANETCKICHDESTDLLAKQVQAGSSVHLTGGHHERSEAACAACHTHEGYIDRMTSGEIEASIDIEDATPPNCRTCHKIHEMYDETDWDLRYTDAVALWINNVSVDFGNGNTCSNCHQPRVPDPLPEIGGDSVTIRSPYWGPHHGTQSSILWGTAGYEIAGDVSYPSTPGNSTHAGAGCTSCHMTMVPEYGNLVGGHTFNMTYDDHGEETDNVAACKSCHKSIGDDFDYNGVMTATVGLIENLETMLVDKGWLDAESGRVNVNFGSSIKLAADDAGVLLNYFMVVEDKSKGIHNPAYTNALLKNSIQALN